MEKEHCTKQPYTSYFSVFKFKRLPGKYSFPKPNPDLIKFAYKRRKID